MSTRSATIIRQTTYWGEDASTEEIMRFYRHCDGYPEGHGIDMAKSVIASDCCKVGQREWVQGFLARLLAMPALEVHWLYEFTTYAGRAEKTNRRG